MAEIKYTMESHGMSIDIRYVLSPPPSHKQTPSVADPGSGAFLTPGSGIQCLFYPWIRDLGWVKTRIWIRDPGHISESLKNNFWGL
jgi:hypothetical protein